MTDWKPTHRSRRHPEETLMVLAEAGDYIVYQWKAPPLDLRVRTRQDFARAFEPLPPPWQPTHRSRECPEVEVRVVDDDVYVDVASLSVSSVVGGVIYETAAQSSPSVPKSWLPAEQFKQMFERVGG